MDSDITNESWCQCSSFTLLGHKLAIFNASINIVIEFSDCLVKFIKLLGNLSVDSSCPTLLDSFQFFQCFSLLLKVLIILASLKYFFNVSVRSGNNVHKEVVHHISIVSLENQTRWSSWHRNEDFACMKSQMPNHLGQFFRPGSIFLFTFWCTEFSSNLAWSIVIEENFKVAVILNIHL